MNLAQAIDAAQATNEKKLAAEIAALKLALETDAVLHLRRFAEFCKSRGVKALPCAPPTLAGFVRAENALGVPSDRILDAVRAVELAHDAAAISNPAATAATRAELSRILKIEPPRWNKEELLVFWGLSPEAQAIVSRHSKLDSNAVRKAQNETAELRNKLKAFEQKGIENVTSVKETT
jgi:hypothetical protein